ncbi:group-specific protein [Mesobacillus boroniphilus]|uniref:Group-specific protein n=1 Tax=Mesobacillus boroniphilus TaxID=308892 RepID=A0A944CJV2_9BACI|nr:group-specific protein [Mesobacillus boroniphilus]MBS8264328.1 group-specific protein [Mesobacillus boroniphilus]
MGECNIDHSKADVQEKYQSQKEFLPQDIHPLFDQFFEKEHTQDILNDVFHLLKKYDLATEEDRSERNNRLKLVLKNV